MSKYTMMSRWRRKEMLILYIGFLLLMSLSIAFMPTGYNVKEKSYILLYCIGACFWIGFAGVIYMCYRISNKRKNNYRFNELFGNHKQLGLIHFFQNKEALIVDVMMFMTISIFVIAKVCGSNLQVFFIIFALFIFLFGMHCMLNGMNYKYIKLSNFEKEKKNE